VPIIDFDNRKASRYLMGAIVEFLADPPDSEFQRGFLAAVLTAYKDGLGLGAGDVRIEAAQEVLDRGGARPANDF
jgi:hypothetical protein